MINAGVHPLGCLPESSVQRAGSAHMCSVHTLWLLIVRCADAQSPWSIAPTVR